MLIYGGGTTTTGNFLTNNKGVALPQYKYFNNNKGVSLLQICPLRGCPCSPLFQDAENTSLKHMEE